MATFSVLLYQVLLIQSFNYRPMEMEGVTRHIEQLLRSYQTSKQPFVLLIDGLFSTVENANPVSIW
jgi:hypothetical protein